MIQQLDQHGGEIDMSIKHLQIQCLKTKIGFIESRLTLLTYTRQTLMELSKMYFLPRSKYLDLFSFVHQCKGDSEKYSL